MCVQSALSTLSYQYLQREDFAVVVQPFFQNTLVPLNKRGGADLTFFSEDCFHFSERGHAEMAIALWNNMLQAHCDFARHHYANIPTPVSSASVARMQEMEVLSPASPYPDSSFTEASERLEPVGHKTTSNNFTYSRTKLKCPSAALSRE
ncbi:hypothetical protein Celaphus_00005418 [Cervus elaphus hippelaphus]|uniref:PLB1 n=1 Tax=Cervus elaphus hippelaphus TaxID=46360 RepID=A0A212CWU7_CEREH|nr:hypothetical protein Celaphus_00005418 [Cervus elaphus hippelaphus]